MIVKLCAGPAHGGSARGALQYARGYAGGPLAKSLFATVQEQREAHGRIIQESLSRRDRGIDIIWEPKAAHGLRPAATFCHGGSSYASFSLEVDLSHVSAREWLIKDSVIHIVTSFNHEESKWISNEQVINMARHMLADEEVGLQDHKYEIDVHRDTCRYDNGELIDGNVHAHCMVSSINPKTNLPWIRHRDMYRLHHGARSAEDAFSTPEHPLKNDHGLMTVRTDEHGVKRIEPATRAELQAWRQITAEHKMQTAIRNRADAYYEYRLKHSTEWASDVVAPEILKYFEKCQSENEQCSWAIVHHICAEQGGRLGYDAASRELTVRLVLKTEGEGESKTGKQEHAPDWDGTQRVDEFGDPLPERKAQALGPATIMPTKNVIGAEPPSAARTAEKDAWLQRRAFLPTYQNLEDAETAFIERNERDIAWASRSIVNDGKAVFDVSDISRFLAQGVTDADSISEMTQWIEDHDSTLVPLTGEGTAKPLRTAYLQYTTKKQHTLEHETRDVLERLAKQRPAFDRASLARAISEIESEKNITIDDEGRRVLEGLSHGLSWTQGDPGIGKTTLTAVVVRLQEISGKQVLGLTPTSRSAEELEDRSGAYARNTTLALMNPRLAEQIAPGTILLCDETSMLPMRHLKAIATVALERGALLMGFGDAAQITPVASAGDTHGLACDVAKKYGAYTEAHNVRRQQNDLEWMRPVVTEFGQAIREENPEAIVAVLKRMDKHGVFTFCADREETIKAAAVECAAAIARGEHYVANAANLKDVRQLNKEIREAVGITGGRPFWTPKGGVELCERDRILFMKNDKTVGVYNGYTGTVTAVEHFPEREKFSRRGIGVYKVHVQLDNGRSVEFDPRVFTRFSHGYARSVHTSQSLSIALDIPVTVHKQDARSAFVGATRGINALKWFVAENVYPIDSERKGMSPIQAFAEGIAQRTEGQSSALFWERQEARYGGPDSYWATNVKRAMQRADDPLYRKYLREEDAQAERRQIELGKQHDKTLTKMQTARSDEAIKNIEFAHIKACERIMKKYPSKSFLEWAAEPARAKAIEKQGALDAQVEKIRHERKQEHERAHKPTRGERLAREMESQARMREQQRAKEHEHDRGMSFGR